MTNLRETALPFSDHCYVVTEEQLRAAEAERPTLHADCKIRVVRFSELAEGAEFILCQGAGGAGRRFRKKAEGDFSAEWATDDSDRGVTEGFRCHVPEGAPCLVGVENVRELAWLRERVKSPTAARMWINQPSEQQGLHGLHGRKVLALPDGDDHCRVYFLEGETTSMRVSEDVLSEGWGEDDDSQALQRCTEAKAGETWRSLAERLIREREKASKLLRLLRAKRDYMREPTEGLPKPSDLACAYANGVDFAVDCIEGHWTVPQFEQWARRVGRIRDGVDVGRLLSEAVAKLPPGEVLAEVSVSPSTWRVGELAPTSFELLLSTLKREGEATWRSEHRVVGDGKPVLVETRREA